MKKFILALLFAAALALPAPQGGFPAEAAASRYGLKEPLRDLSYLKANPPQITIAADLPVSFDLRDLGAVPAKVRNQNPWGTCWAFATMGSCETSYLLQVQGGGDNFLNVTSRDIDLSELHLAWFVYRAPKGYEHMVFSVVDSDTKRLVRDSGVETVRTASCVLGQGGFWTQSTALLSQGWGFGPVLEGALPYRLVNSEDDKGNPALGDFLARVRNQGPWDFSSVLRVTDVSYLANVTSAEVRKLAKDMIRNRGGLYLSYVDCDAGRKGTAYYCPDSVYETDKNSSGHAVVAVGWNDKFPRENFPTPLPNNDGAWLIRNSWGENAVSHDHGYFWMSYEQPNLTAASFVVGPAGDNLQLYEHDPLGWITEWGEGKTSCAANVFQADSDGELAEVGFYTTDNNAKVEVYVNTGYGASAPTASTVALGDLVSSDTFPCAGYHTLRLKNPVNLTGGQYFSVALRVENLSKDSPIAVETRWEGTSDYSIAYDGQTYLSNNDGKSWIDGTKVETDIDNKMQSTPMNACIKAFVRAASSVAPAQEEEKLETIAGMEVTASPEGTVSSRDILDRNPVVNEDSYTGRVVSQVAVDNDGEPLAEGTEVELNLVLVSDLYDTYPIDTSKWGVREKSGDVGALFPAGCRPGRFFDDGGLLFPVYGPFPASADAEGRVTIDADNLVSEGTKARIPAGYYDVFYTAGEASGWLRVITITEAQSGGSGGEKTKHHSGGCDMGLGGWIVLGLAAAALRERR